MHVNEHRRLHALVLVVFLYQINVCPCGHLEHNGWYQLAKSFLAPQTVAAGQLDYSQGFSAGSDESHDCEEAEFTYLVNQRVNVDALKNYVSISYCCNEEQVDLKTSSLASLALESEVTKRLHALEIRAQLQVFIL